MYQTLNNNYEENKPPCNDIELGNSCIICFEVDEKEIINIKDIKKTIGTCSCSGYAHTECINKWYLNKNNIRCIMCNTLITRKPQRVITTRTSVNTQPISCKVMVFIILITTFIVIIIFYPDAFERSKKAETDDYSDTSYLEAIMVGQY